MKRLGAIMLVALWAVAADTGFAAEKNLRHVQLMAGDELDDRYWIPDRATKQPPDVGPWEPRPAATADGPPVALDDGAGTANGAAVTNGHSVLGSASLAPENVGGDGAGIRPAPVAPIASRIGAMMAKLNAPPAPELPGFGLHIASFRTPERALRAWRDLQELHHDVFGPLTPRIVPVDLGAAGGRFYQLYAGPIQGREAAQLLCEDIARRNLYCAPTMF